MRLSIFQMICESNLMDMDAAIYKANEKMTFLANDKEVLRLYNMREMAQNMIADRVFSTFSIIYKV